MQNNILVLIVFLLSGNFCLAACPSADLTRNCFVDYEDSRAKYHRGTAILAVVARASSPCPTATPPKSVARLNTYVEDKRLHAMRSICRVRFFAPL